jgi:hypothetical protein
MRARGWLTPALRTLQATDSAHFGVTGRARMHSFRLVALVIYTPAWFERFWPEMERHTRDCVLLAVCWGVPRGAPMVVYVVINVFLCVYNMLQALVHVYKVEGGRG